MTHPLFILICEALAVYFIVLFAHSLRHRFGPVHFYALIGGLTAIMSWVTDAGLKVAFAGITFYVGSTVFYTSLLLAVFVIYVFDGIHITRVMISTIVGVSAMVPIIAMVLHLQNALLNGLPLATVPLPSLRINTASIVTTIIDMISLAIIWEFLGNNRWRIPLWLRTFLTLLAVMWLDVLLFTTGAFAGTPDYLNIMKGTLISRLFISLLAFPILYAYIYLQNRRGDIQLEKRPALAILMQMAKIRRELTEAQQEIARRMEAERALKKALDEVKTLRGMIPMCANCKSIRDDEGYWQQIEEYLSAHSEAQFSHGVCPSCMNELYPDFSEKE